MRAVMIGTVAVLALAGCAGCTGGAGDAGGPAPGASSVPAEAHSLRPDGSVPWVDEPITDADLHGRPPGPRVPKAGSRPCRADQLTGVLEAWNRAGNGGETPRGMDAAAGHLIGHVDVRNRSTVECTLRGEVPTRMLAGGREVPMHYTHGINDEARARVVAVPAGERVHLRLDWSGPFCVDLEGPLELAIALPDNGGTLRAPVTAAGRPPCAQGENVNPNLRATLYASGFTEPPRPAPTQASPLTGLTLTITGPDAAASGDRVVYHATLTNPTAAAVPLDPCPGYRVELYVQGSADRRGVNQGQLYRLNCRPVREIPAGGSVRFEMVVVVPRGLAVGQELSVGWRLLAAHFANGSNQWVQLQIRIG